MFDRKGLIYGLAIGDALGVPAEFLSRKELKRNPITDMIGGGFHKQVEGTWSDDTSMVLCLVDAFRKNDVDWNKFSENLLDWFSNKNSTFNCHGYRFDIGNTTYHSLEKLFQNPTSFKSGAADLFLSNGSLMRCSPLAFYKNDIKTKVKNNASFTHLSKKVHSMDLFLILYIQELQKGKDKFLSFENVREKIPFRDISVLNEDKIYSTGFCVHTLEAAIWCFLNSNSYEDAVLKAVNLGDDTDTVGAVCGAISGSYYGFNSIPLKWIEKLKNKKKINDTISQWDNYCV